MSTSRLTVVVSGMIAADPGHGGAAWAVLQYLRGLQRLGHDVFFVEPIAIGKLRPSGASLSTSVNAGYFNAVVTQFGFQRRAALLQHGTTETFGMSYTKLAAVVRRADVLLNISGMLDDPALIEPIPRRLYLDLDPAFNQLWHAVDGIDMRFDAHTHHVTVGQAIGTPSCAIPTCGRRWTASLPPVSLADWPVAPLDPAAAFTTVANWRGYGSIQHNGTTYGQKAHSLRALLPLPSLTDESLLLALSIDPGETSDLERLALHRWRMVDPREVAATPDQYRDFVSRSKGELGIAKSGYVVSRCGWVSDRSACYLAAGRPVIVQDTGFGDRLPVGEGLLTFATLDEAAAALRAVAADYPRHCAAARRIAEEYFDSDTVLTRLLAHTGAAP